MKQPKYYAVINTKWEEDGWSEPFYEIRGEQIFVLTVFNSEIEAQEFKNISKRKKDKIVEVSIIIKK